MKKLLFITIMTVVFSSGFALNTAIAKEQSVTLDIPGMYCPTCPFTVRKSLEKLDGVKNVKTSSKTKMAVVTYDPSKLTIDALINATTNVGYPSTVNEKNND